MTLTIQFREDDLDDDTIEEAVASDEKPMRLFRRRLRAIANSAESVEDGDRKGALIYAVNEVVRGANHVDNSGNVSNDSSDLRGDKFDLRNHTKLD